MHSVEVKHLHNWIADLLAESAMLRDAVKSKTDGEGLVLQLREANQNLVKAALGAQDMQAIAEATNRRQEEFLSMLAHELRNPLAPIAGAVELLGKMTTLDPQLPKLHGVLSRQISHMTRLVDDLMDASRVSSGKITLQKHALMLSKVIESAAETSQPLNDKRHQQLIIDLPAEPIEINGDFVRLAQVFSNLLINAAKFTPEYGRITVTARKLAATVSVSIKDNGMGIAPDKQPFIFDLFTQGFCALDRSQGGLGIGLALVRTLVTMHGGTVQVRSDGAGLGSEFIVQLPVVESAAPLPHTLRALPETDVFRHCHILLIEDNVDANDMLNDFLSLAGHTVTSAFDGTTGVAMAKENSYDIIVSDIGLPGMDGYEVVKQVRLDALKPAPICIALSGYNQSENRTRAIEAGFDHYLVKPVNTASLMSIISSCVHH